MPAMIHICALAIALTFIIAGLTSATSSFWVPGIVIAFAALLVIRFVKELR